MSAYTLANNSREMDLVSAGINSGAADVLFALARAAGNKGMRATLVKEARERHHSYLRAKRALKERS